MYIYIYTCAIFIEINGIDFDSKGIFHQLQICIYWKE